MFSVAVVVLAAGGSARLGRPKQLLSFRGTTLIRHAVETALAAEVGPVFVVLGAAAADCERELRDLEVQVVPNANWDTGIGTSVRAGISTVSEFAVDGAIFCLCDQPLVTAADLRELVRIWRGSGAPAAAAGYCGSIGVPAVFSRTEFESLAALDGASGAKSHLTHLGMRVAVIELPHAALDIDTPSNVDRLRLA